MQRTPLLTIAIVGSFALSLGAIACGGGGGGGGGSSTSESSGGSGEVSENTFVGRVAETEAFIAIMKEGTAHLIYVTDGKDLNLWFKGNASGAVAGYFTFYNDEGGSIVNSPDGDGHRGNVSDGKGLHLRYTAAAARGDAGLYRAAEAAGGEAWQIGWIVLNDGQVRGARQNAAGVIRGETVRGGVKWTDPAKDP
jgi:hypothetical protein